jgi:hypothetical protein
MSRNALGPSVTPIMPDGPGQSWVVCDMQVGMGMSALGVLTVSVAPPFTLRRTRRMDIPSTLRVME